MKIEFSTFHLDNISPAVIMSDPRLVVLITFIQQTLSFIVVVASVRSH